MNNNSMYYSSPMLSFFAVFFKCQFTKNWNPACALSWAIIDTRDEGIKTKKKKQILSKSQFIGNVRE
jgi:hypothetical protein